MAHEIHYPHETPCSIRLQDSTSQIGTLSMPSPCRFPAETFFFISLAPARPSNSIQASPSQQSSTASHRVNAAPPQTCTLALVTPEWFPVDYLSSLQNNPSSKSLVKFNKCSLTKESWATPFTTHCKAGLKPWIFVFIHKNKYLIQSSFFQPSDSHHGITHVGPQLCEGPGTTTS